MENIAAGRAAETLLAEHKADLRFKTLGPQNAPATISDAYDIQDKYVALLHSEHGATVGYKVGLTSATLQAFCRIDHPIAGVVLARRVYRSKAIVRRSDYGRLGLEFEIAVRIKSDLPVESGPLTADLIERHIVGHPFNSVAWLASQLASRGVGLKAGQVVMTGSVMKTVFPEEDAFYRFDLEQIGSVEVQLMEQKSAS